MLWSFSGSRSTSCRKMQLQSSSLRASRTPTFSSLALLKVPFPHWRHSHTYNTQLHRDALNQKQKQHELSAKHLTMMPACSNTFCNIVILNIQLIRVRMQDLQCQVTTTAPTFLLLETKARLAQLQFCSTDLQDMSVIT